MPDLDLSFQVARDALGLGPLECNDGISYKIADTMLGGQVSWNRTQIGSPHTDGQTTTARQMQMVQEPTNIDVLASSATQLQNRMATLIAAFKQADYTITVTVDGAVFEYQCEASDYTTVWTGPRWMARRGQLQVQIMRQPRMLQGAW